MDYNELKTLLSDYDKEKVNVYLGYLREIELSGDKNRWFKTFSASNGAALYKKVAIDNLYIDGDTITLQYKGRVTISYNYQAYKNKLINVYPETMFDLQTVCNGDTFEFRKENGKVLYKHILGNPFDDKKKTIGAYCIIKNARGEFIEVLNMSEIAKMKNVAKTKNVWNTWEDEMILKSVIKRACKRHFKDSVTNMDLIDNENYDLELVDIDSEIQTRIEEAKTAAQLTNVFNLYTGKSNDEKAFLTLLGEKRKEIEHGNS